MIGALTGGAEGERLAGSLAAAVVAAINGARIIRAHDVRPTVEALAVVAASGAGASALEGMVVPIAERISGWVFANAQSVLNSDAILELGPVARTFPTPLRYVAAVPIQDGAVVAVLAVFGPDPFDKDHKRLLENASTLFAASLSQPLHAERAETSNRRTDGISRIH